MPLIKNGAFADDAFAAIADDEALRDGPIVVSLARFQKDREQLLARNVALGVRLQSSENPELLGEDVQRLSLIVLMFPVFRDGRAFSWARILRERLKFTGEIRASGHFLYDQIAYMRRIGFDAWDAPESLALEHYNRALGEITNVYQPSMDGRKTIRALRAGRHP